MALVKLPSSSPSHYNPGGGDGVGAACGLVFFFF